MGYHTSDNYQSTGCYNLDCGDFIQTSSSYCLGCPFTEYSRPGDESYQWHMHFQVFHDGDNWWVQAYPRDTPEWIGYYPGSIYGSGQLRQYATRTDFGGETYNFGAG